MAGRAWGNDVVGRNFVGLECRATVCGRSSTVPADYLTMDGCAVVAVWTKRGFGNVPVLGPQQYK